MKEIYIFYLIGERNIGKKCVKKYIYATTYIYTFVFESLGSHG